jgi:hypothetical protein
LAPAGGPTSSLLRVGVARVLTFDGRHAHAPLDFVLRHLGTSRAKDSDEAVAIEAAAVRVAVDEALDVAVGAGRAGGGDAAADGAAAVAAAALAQRTSRGGRSPMNVVVDEKGRGTLLGRPGVGGVATATW